MPEAGGARPEGGGATGAGAGEAGRGGGGDGVRVQDDHVLQGGDGVAGGLRGGSRRGDLQHARLPGGGGPPGGDGPLRRRRGSAVRASGEVADGQLQPHQLLHPLPPPRRRHPRLPGHERMASNRPPAVVRTREGRTGRPFQQPHPRFPPHRRDDHGEQRDDRWAGGDVVVHVQVRQAQEHPRLPDRAAVLELHPHLGPHTRQLPLLEHPPRLQQRDYSVRNHNPSSGALPKHRWHQSRFLLQRPDRGLLRRLRRRLHRDQERVGRVRHRGGDAEPAHQHPAAHLHLPHQRRHRPRQRDVRRHPGRPRRGHHRHRLRVRRPHQDRRRPRRLRPQHLRAALRDEDHEVGLLDDGQLRLPRRRRLRPQRRPRRRRHQLQRHSGGEREHGGAAGGHPRRPLPGGLHLQRHHPGGEVEEGAVDLRRRGGVHELRRPAGVRSPARGAGWWVRGGAVPVPGGEAAHRGGRVQRVFLHRGPSKVKPPRPLLVEAGRHGCGCSAS